MDSININQRLQILDGDIVAITLLIASEKTKRENTADAAEKAVILDSIKVLNAEKAVLITQRGALQTPASSTSQGKICLYPSIVIPSIFEPHYALCMF
jgi:hypothetical protein